MCRASVIADGFSYFDESGTARARMADDGIFYYDENSARRAGMGRVRLVIPSAGAETTYPAQVVLYDAESKVIWEALGGR